MIFNWILVTLIQIGILKIDFRTFIFCNFFEIAIFLYCYVLKKKKY